jgi:hypothetical protein
VVESTAGVADTEKAQKSFQARTYVKFEDSGVKRPSFGTEDALTGNTLARNQRFSDTRL